MPRGSQLSSGSAGGLPGYDWAPGEGEVDESGGGGGGLFCWARTASGARPSDARRAIEAKRRVRGIESMSLKA
jgi:hypothetical protein